MTPKRVNVYEAKTHLSQLLADVASGKEIIIARSGHPVARLVPIQREASPRIPGELQGEIWMAPDFDEVDGEIAELFNNSQLFPDKLEDK